MPSRNVNTCTSKAKAVGRRRLRLGEGGRAKNRHAGRARRSGALQAQKCAKLNYVPEQGIQGIAHLSKATHTPGGIGIVTKEKMTKHREGGRAKNGGAS